MHWLAACLDFGRNLHTFQRHLETVHEQAQHVKLNKLTRFQRSLVSGRVAAVSKDSTVGLSNFVSVALAAMKGLLGDKPSSLNEMKVGTAIANDSGLL